MTGEHVELRLRSVSSWTVGRDGTFVDDLEVLAARGIIDDYEVRMVPGKIPLDPDVEVSPREATVRERVREMFEWADDRSYDLPAFGRRTVPQPELHGLAVQVLPLATLAGYEDGQLQWMAPYSDGDDHVSVQDRLDELAERAPPTPGERSEAAIALGD